jgi:glycosyltransferase involved in cell wall biosynthesis
MIRVLQFANIINRHDFIEVIVNHADPSRIMMAVCVRSRDSNIAEPLYRPGIQRWLIKGESRSTMPFAACRLANLLRLWRADIVHTHHYDQAIIAWLATRIHRATRLIVGRHYSDDIYRLSHGLKRKALLQLEGLINRAASRIIVPSRFVREILTIRQRVYAEKIDLIHYGFEPAKYTAPAAQEVLRIRKEFDLDGRFSIGTFGRLHEGKGHRYLLQAAAVLRDRVPGFRVLVAGDGPERIAIAGLIERQRLGGIVNLVGHRENAMAFMSAVDAVVQPTLHEAFSQVMAEAMWMRKPLVISDVGGAVDIIRDGDNGLLVPRGDKDALANAIERLFRDPGLRKRLAANGRAFAEEHLSIQHRIADYEQSYLRAMES